MEILKVVFPLKHHLIHMWFENDVIWIENIFLQFNMGKLFPVSFEISSWGGSLYPMLLQRSVCSKRFYARVYEIRGTASYLGLNFCALGA